MKSRETQCAILRSFNVKLLVYFTFFLLAFAHQIWAGQITSPTDVINNTMGEFSESFRDDFMIDQSGLSSGFISGVVDFDIYLSGTPTHAFDQTNVGWGSP